MLLLKGQTIFVSSSKRSSCTIDYWWRAPVGACIPLTRLSGCISKLSEELSTSSLYLQNFKGLSSKEKKKKSGWRLIFLDLFYLSGFYPYLKHEENTVLLTSFYQNQYFFLWTESGLAWCTVFYHILTGTQSSWSPTTSAPSHTQLLILPLHTGLPTLFQNLAQSSLVWTIFAPADGCWAHPDLLFGFWFTWSRSLTHRLHSFIWAQSNVL